MGTKEHLNIQLLNINVCIIDDHTGESSPLLMISTDICVNVEDFRSALKGHSQSTVRFKHTRLTD